MKDNQLEDINIQSIKSVYLALLAIVIIAAIGGVVAGVIMMFTMPFYYGLIVVTSSILLASLIWAIIKVYLGMAYDIKLIRYKVEKMAPSNEAFDFYRDAFIKGNESKDKENKKE